MANNAGEPESIKPEFIKPVDVAAYMNVPVDQVRDWIHSNQISAVDVSRQKAQRPRWRIAKSELERFLASRSSDATKTSKVRRKRRQPEHIIKYY